MMIKVTHSSDVSSAVGVGGEVVKSASELRKQASTIFGAEYDALRPPDGMTGIHLVALGDSEAYPMNRNGDLFPKEACVKYHETFVKHGHVYEHHRNKDPRKSIGIIKASAYNPDMHRIELYIWADNEKARDHLERLEKTGEVSFSMACRVPKDRCSCCGAIRKQAGGEGECDHVRYSLGKVAEDGTQIGTYNDEPTWFDISFVGRPADRIAWNLKVASAGVHAEKSAFVSRSAEAERYELPDDLAIESEQAKRKLGLMRKLADAYGRCEAWLSGRERPSGGDAALFELRKLAGASLDDETLFEMRGMDPADAFAALGDAGILLDAPSFFKYAFGPDYGSVEKYVPYIGKEAAAAVRGAVESSSCAEFCNFGGYDARPKGILSRAAPCRVARAMEKSSAARCFGLDDPVTSVLEAVASGSCPSFSAGMRKSASAEDAGAVEAMARRYAMYKLAGLCAVESGRHGAWADEDRLVFVAAAQDLADR